jgi:LacI family transcriptional regulator
MHAVFKRELGCTPREYQERAAQAAARADPVPAVPPIP